MLFTSQMSTECLHALTEEQSTSFLIRVLKYLAELELQGNVLTKLPDAVGEMEHLTSINLANNSFSVFPDKLTEIATLERINLEGNSITGKSTILKVITLFSCMA